MHESAMMQYIMVTVEMSVIYRSTYPHVWLCMVTCCGYSSTSEGHENSQSIVWALP